ncbi:MAG TPA: hypothetical protein VKP88_08700, partial [Candidatus Paceibacterota bacterium]|nr:hypothetical protein [Candidatus Paceibacterota bacterium]
MSYNHRANHKPLSTAGKITILTAVSSLFIFLAVFLLNLGQSEIGTVQAQTSGQATTSVNVQNTPPEFDAGGFPEESVASASTSPTNSGDSVTFIATATDQNAAPYFLIVCEDDGSTSAQAASSTSGLGTAPPTCVGGGDTYAVSTSTVSGAQASVSFTTAESNPEENPWIAFACDDDPDNPECSPGYTGDGSATSSPFVVNHRPVFDINTINPSGDPGGDTIEFIASSTDQDTFGGQDTVQLFVCIDAVFDAATPECTNGTIASSTLVTPGTTAPNAAT